VPSLLGDEMGRVTPAASTAFAAIDFETADYGRDSACAIAVVKVEHNKIVDRQQYLIRPPRREFVFSYLHGITWDHVANAPTFRQLWPALRKSLLDVQFLVAHNASFDRSVLHTCCEQASVPVPTQSFCCTMRIARSVWSVHPTTLPDVCRRLRIDLRHHDPMSDAEACARIVIAATTAGWNLADFAR
jgi:DNA polymerase-3 subunit epsilon